MKRVITLQCCGEPTPDGGYAVTITIGGLRDVNDGNAVARALEPVVVPTVEALFDAPAEKVEPETESIQ